MPFYADGLGEVCFEAYGAALAHNFQTASVRQAKVADKDGEGCVGCQFEGFGGVCAFDFITPYPKYPAADAQGIRVIFRE